jgi:hypothetical protein
MERNELLDKFFEMKCKQMLLKLWLMAFAKPGYVGSEVGLCMKHMEVQSKLDDVEDEMLKLLQANETFFRGADLDGYCQEYKISMDRQKEISKEILDREYTIEDLIEKVERR